MSESTVQEKSDLVKKWSYEIDQYDKRMEKWRKRCKIIIERYAAERKGVNDQKQPRFNSLWANIQTMMPALYARVPKPEIERRFRSHDDVARVASELLQRCCSFSMATGDSHTRFKQSVFDYLMVARGTLWVRYTAEYRDIERAEENEEVSDDEPLQEVSWEEVIADYVHWLDFGHTDGRTWEEVTGVWRKSYLTRKQLVSRFKEKGKKVPLNWSAKDDNYQESTADSRPTREKKAVIYEIWDKNTGKAIWICKDYHEELDLRDDPLKLRNFFPCPKPLYATITNEKLEPIPDYILYQDQAVQLDELTQRIGSIIKSVKVAGVFDASAPGIQRLLDEGIENQLIPVESWAAFAEKGGMVGAVQWLPLDMIVKVLNELYQAREAVKKDMYEITGQSDLMRGDTDPDETATAQGLKSSYISMRFQDRRDEIQLFLCQTVQIMCEVISSHFGAETLKTMSGLKLFDTPDEKDQAKQQIEAAKQQATQTQQPPPDVPEDMQDMLNEPTWQEVIGLIKSDEMRAFRIDIETDSTIRADESKEKIDRKEMLTAISAFMDKAQNAPPQMAPLMGQLLLFTVRAFRVGRQLEGDFEQAIEQMRKEAANPKPPPPTPEMQKVQGQLQLQQAKTQGDQQMEQMRAQMEDAQHQRELAAEAQAAQRDAQIAAQLEEHKQLVQAQQNQHQNELEAARAQQQSQMDSMLEQQRMVHEEGMARMDGQLQMLLARIDNAAKVEVAEIGAQTTIDSAQISAANAAAPSE